jgi:ferrous iron transport protein A
MKTLAELKIGEEARMASIEGNDETRKRLETLGFVPGTPVRVLQIAAGNLILAVHESRVGVGKEVAARIRVGAG